MTVDQQVRVLCASSKISIAELGRRIGQSSQNMSNKLKKGSFTVAELKKIAEVTGTEYINYFQFPNGDKIQ